MLGVVLAGILAVSGGTRSAAALDASPAVEAAPAAPVTVAARRPKLARIVRGLVAAGAPGALAVVRTPTRTRSAAAGLAAIDPRLRLNARDRYRIASVTKTFVATRVLQLVAQGRLRLTDSVDRWLPGLVPNGATITIRQLLNHTSGLFEYSNDPDWAAAVFAQPGREWSPRELLAVATSHPPLFAPGASWSYSNTNYVVLRLILETVTAVPLATDLRDRLFQPLGLSSTSFPTGTEVEGRYAHGYVGRASLPNLGTQLLDISAMLNPSHGGVQLISNAFDLTRFFAALLKGRLLPSNLLRAMKITVFHSNYGLGLRRTASVCGVAFGHDGDSPGYRNVVWGSANGRRTAAVMVNIDTTRVSWSRLHAAARAALCSG